MSRAKYLKEVLKENINKDLGEIQTQILKEKADLASLSLDFFRGRSKQNHNLRRQKRKIAVLKTMRTQKRYLAEKGT